MYPKSFIKLSFKDKIIKPKNRFYMNKVLHFVATCRVDEKKTYRLILRYPKLSQSNAKDTILLCNVVTFPKEMQF